MAVNCDPTSLANAGSCMDCVIPPGQQLAVQTYLLAVKAGGSSDPNTLIGLAKDFQSLSEKTLLEIQAYLLCQLANA